MDEYLSVYHSAVPPIFFEFRASAADGPNYA
jgi:hypothetical protein